MEIFSLKATLCSQMCNQSNLADMVRSPKGCWRLVDWGWEESVLKMGHCYFQTMFGPPWSW